MKPETRLIIVVEDSDEDYAVLTRLLRRLNVPNTLHRCTSGDACLDYLAMLEAAPKSTFPALIMLDLNLPGTNGREVLDQVKHHPVLKSIPVTVVTTSTDERDVTDCYDRGANSYIVKQGDLDAYQRILSHMVNYWFDAVTLP